MFPSWLSRFKQGRKSCNKTAPSEKKHNESPAVLARSLSLQRANARAKSTRPESLVDPHSSARRFSKSIDALYFFSKLKEGVQPIDVLASDNCDGGPFPAKDPEINMASLSQVEDRMKQGLDLWDREFSSMSSYGSDHDAVPERQKWIPLSGGSKSGSGSKRAAAERALSAPNEIEDFETDCSCSRSDSANSVVRCKCGCDDEWREVESMWGLTGVSGESWTEKVQRRRRRGHDSSSLSAVLPPDLKGVVGESIALVKISYNPHEDFRKSLYEMVTEKGLKNSVDIEELLYCYLSLNAPEHYDLIKQAFRDVWSEVWMRSR